LARTAQEHPQRTLRLFFALWPDAATRARLAAWAEAIHHASGGRMMRAPNIHLTLAFLGTVSAALLPATERAAAAVPPARFTLTLDEPGYWRHNRIAWAGARVVPDALAGLVSALRSALGTAQIPFDPKPFVPHVTLVRNVRSGFALPALEPIAWPVEGFALVRSVTGASGSAYVVQASWC
jgi:2'-5' RNA ligase